MFVLIIILIIFCVILWLTWKYKKKFNFDSICQVNGAVGSGKTSTCVYFAIRECRIKRRNTKIKNFFRKLFKKDLLEMPLLYSNIPLFENRKKSNDLLEFYVPFTYEHIIRKKRFNYNSVIFLSESSLIANSMDSLSFKANNNDINDRLNLFLKLIRHETKSRGCCLFTETQSRNDNHYAFDRNISTCLFITKAIKIPFFRLVWCRELIYSDNTLNQFDDDIKESDNQYWYLVPKKVFKNYDSYAYSFLTDDLEKLNDFNIYLDDDNKRFFVTSLHKYNEIEKSNFDLIQNNKRKEEKKENE